MSSHRLLHTDAVPAILRRNVRVMDRLLRGGLAKLPDEVELLSKDGHASSNRASLKTSKVKNGDSTVEAVDDSLQLLNSVNEV